MGANFSSVELKGSPSSDARGSTPCCVHRLKTQAESEIIPAAVRGVLRTPGEPLDRTTRSFMESRFGHDFSQIRIHAGSVAAESAQAVNAHAYAVGQHVVFGSGQFAPATTMGRRLIAHELAHVVQQSGDTADLSTDLAPGSAERAEERQAALAADAVGVRGEECHVPRSGEGVVLARQPAGPPPSAPTATVSPLQVRADEFKASVNAPATEVLDPNKNVTDTGQNFWTVQIWDRINGLMNVRLHGRSPATQTSFTWRKR